MGLKENKREGRGRGKEWGEMRKGSQERRREGGVWGANGRGLSLDLDRGSLLFIDCLVAGPRGRRRIKTCLSVQLLVLAQNYIFPFLTQTTVL